ncbi:acylneuraminate cytidylyltransferase family protein [Metabacillus rhizolycopersici]|uniref:Acylneuraminate cytidylyltransferase family protein n=1 Tax=Metabacillus rhizolycopersici TaxID=2875709 RepID=A0ABS7UV01_9BACI|nr:acylneuraminate cytidylyltransferase family protein [Metabacillus rhizolycopersici]MBZ5751976.1 acylneuraminate cytidylyltransferase family protein [Metabacillus rhizolycopersici]
MSDNQKIIALIPARGGSKTIPYKNIKSFYGKPLIAWTIEVAKQVTEIDRIIVSTDDDQIAEVARQYGAEIMKREIHLALDDSMPIDVIKNVLMKLRSEGNDAKYMLYLEPTSPLRTSSDLQQCIKLLTDQTNFYKSIASYCEADLNPHRAWRLNKNIPEVFIKGADPWLPRQKLPKAYQLNGAVYGFSIDSILNGAQTILPQPTGSIIMQKENSIDIDDEVDFILAELLLKRRLNNEKA